MASIERRQTASGVTRWDVRYRDPDRRPRTRTFHRKSDAQKFANVVEADITRGDWLDPRLGRETFGDWAGRWVPTIAGLTPKTRESYESILRRHLLPRFEDVPVNRIDHPTVVALIAKLTSNGPLPARCATYETCSGSCWSWRVARVRSRSIRSRESRHRKSH